MALVEWSEDYSVNISRIDKQHQQMLDIIDRLYASMRAGKGDEHLGHILDRLLQYAEEHFSLEEGLMRQYGYPDIDAHIKEHGRLRKHVLKMKYDYESGSSGLSISVLMFLRDWLVNHMKDTDQKYVRFFQEKGLK